MVENKTEINEAFQPPQGSRRRIVLTGLILLGMIILIMGLGIGSGLVARQRHNEQILPRILLLYEIHPDGSLRFVKYVNPADPQLTDDDIPPEADTVQLFGPTVFDENAIAGVDVIGLNAERVELVETDFQPSPTIAGASFPVYTLERLTGDGPFGVDVQVEQSPQVSETAFFINAVQDTRYAQTMLALALPRLARDQRVVGYEAYRDVRLGAWQVYYFDVSVVADPVTISIAYDMTGLDEPEGLAIEQVDTGR